MTVIGKMDSQVHTLGTDNSTLSEAGKRILALTDLLKELAKFTFVDRWAHKGFDDEAQALFDKILLAGCSPFENECVWIRNEFDPGDGDLVISYITGCAHSLVTAPHKFTYCGHCGKIIRKVACG